MPLRDQLRDEIFHAAVQLEDAAQQSAFLARACAEDKALRDQVEALLKAEAAASDFFRTGEAHEPRESRTPGPPPSAPDRVLEHVGSIIGPYELLETIGEGGFGIVYQAQQTAPVKRQVALKVIKLGMDTQEVVRRFNAERQALALMQHANIAAVYDAGTTDTGRPYFVMELVSGRPLTAYCDAQGLSVFSRLQLFAQVCQAVHHAHQKGVIHRDLKPSNILVTEVDGQPVPKVIDFGIVKAAGPRLTSETLATRAQELVGTPAYMSPEQASLGQMDIDTRSDVYSLGVLLYELLTGTQPFGAERFRTSSLVEILQAIQKEEPCKPSLLYARIPEAELVATAGLRQAGPRQLARLVRGDLDWIVMKALEKDRSRRYQSANGLAQDVERFLDHRPVSAAAPSAAYRFRKLARRHRAAFVAAGCILATLILSAIISIASAVRAIRAERLTALEAKNTQRQASIAEAVKRFLTEDVFSAADPMAVNTPDRTVRQALDQAVGSLEQRFKAEPLVEGEIRATLARIYSNLGESKKALPHAQRALELRRRELGEEDRETLRAKRSLALLYLALRQQNPEYFSRAESMLEEALATSQSLLKESDEVAVDLKSALATVYHDREKFIESSRLNEQALSAWTNAHGLYNSRAAHMLANLAGSYASYPGNEIDDPRKQNLFELALDVSRKVFGDRNPNNVLRLINLGTFYLKANQVSKAEATLDEAVVLAEGTLGGTHPWTWSALRSSMEVRLRQGRIAEAVKVAEEELLVRSKRSPATAPAMIEAVTRIGDEFEREGAVTEALTFYRAGLQRLGTNRPTESQSLAYVSYWLVATAQYEQAMKALTELETRLPPGESQPLNFDLGSRIALLALLAQRPASYDETCRRLLDRFNATTATDARIADTVARTCLLSPRRLDRGQDTKLSQCLDLVRQGIPSTETELRPWMHLTLGLERYRAADADAALENLRATSGGSLACRATSLAFMAAIYANRADHDRAEQALADGRRFANEAKAPRFASWHEHLLFLIAEGEAQKALNGRSSEVR